MNYKPQPISLIIMGKEYKIACAPDEQSDLLQSAQKLDFQMRQMRDSGKVAGADRIEVNLAHELQLMKIQNAQLSKTLNECLGKMTHKIENVLEN